MRNFKKDERKILINFDRECLELCYTNFIPNEVKAARDKIEAAMPQGPTKMEIVKERVMHTLRNLFDPDKFRDDLYSTFDENGEVVTQ